MGMGQKEQQKMIEDALSGDKAAQKKLVNYYASVDSWEQYKKEHTRQDKEYAKKNKKTQHSQR